MNETKKLGEVGEELATQFLYKKGYRIIGRNIRLPNGEIDILAVDQDSLVLVEVKTKSSLTYGQPLEMITKVKQGKLCQLALLLIQDYGMVKYRIDAIGIYCPSRSLSGPSTIIEHIVNI